MLGLSLPFASGEAEAAGADIFAPNAFIRIERRRADCPDDALCRDGPGHLHIHPDADRRRAGGGPEAGAAGACSTQREALRQPACWACRQPATRTRYAAAWQPLRQAGATARTMLVSAAAKRWNVDPASCRAQSGEVLHAPTGRRSNMANLPPMPPACPSPKTWRSSDRRTSSSSAHRPSVSIRRRRSTEPPSTASTFDRRA